MYKAIPDRWLFALALFLCFPAFLLHLGLIGFIGDEAIRTLVAFEMHHSGNFIVPTLNGELYFNKPPLYNWLIYGISMAFGYFGEWPTRLTTLLSLTGFAWAVFHYTKKNTDPLTAISMTLMLLTSGRILFWDSMLGLIDTCFSAVVFLNFILLYQFGKSGQGRKMFLLSYLLFAIAFLLKGLPAVVFQGLSILATLWYFKQLRQKLFSADHLLGALAGIMPVILYYIVYAQYVSLENVFGVLTDQSLQRTATHHGIWKTVQHVFTFPLEQTYHFLPWSLLVLSAFHPKARTWLRENDFVRFCLLMLLVNIPVYWISVQVYPRYLLMFVPLFNLTGFFIFSKSLQETISWWRILHSIFLGMTGLGTIGILGLLFYPQTKALPGIGWIWILCSAAMIFILLGLIHDRRRMFIWMACGMLVIRIIFDFVVLPLRAETSKENITRESCQNAAMAHAERPWFNYGMTELHEVARFYTAAYSDQIIRKTYQLPDPAALYLVEDGCYPEFPGMAIDSIILERGQIVYLMKRK